MLRYYSQSAADFYTNIDDFLKPLSESQSAIIGCQHLAPSAGV